MAVKARQFAGTKVQAERSLPGDTMPVLGPAEPYMISMHLCVLHRFLSERVSSTHQRRFLLGCETTFERSLPLRAIPVE